MRNILINMVIILILAVMYYTNAFGVISSNGIFIFATILLIVMVLIALKILGNPFKRVDDDDDK